MKTFSALMSGDQPELTMVVSKLCRPVAVEVTRRMPGTLHEVRFLSRRLHADLNFQTLELIGHDLQPKRCGRNRRAVQTLNFCHRQSAIIETEIIQQTVDGFGNGAVTTDAQRLTGLQHG